MDRVFLDANVLFSAAYLSDSPLNALLQVRDAEFVTSPFAAAEAMRNMLRKRPNRAATLSGPLSRIGLVADRPGAASPAVALPEKDVPILAAAIACRASHLLTGDSHFGHLFGRFIDGALVLRPSDYLAMKHTG